MPLPLARTLPLVAALALLGAADAPAETRIAHEGPDFSLTLPAAFKTEEAPPGLLCLLTEAEAPAGERPIAISIDRLGGLLGRTPLSREEAAAAIGRIAPGAIVTLERAHWRDAAIDVIRAEVAAAGGARGLTVSFSARIPLSGEAIQLNVGGPSSREKAIRGVLGAALAGLDGSVEWAEDAARRRVLSLVGVAGGLVVAALGLALVRRGRRRAGAE